MAFANPSILSFGASHLSLTVLGQSSDGLVLEQVFHQSLSGDPEMKDQWLQSLDPALGQLANKAQLKAVTSIVLPGWAVLTKTLRVTRIDGEGQREVVRFEAENAMPNGLEGYEWSFSVLKDDGFERDVVVQAVSASFLSGLLKLLSTHGVQPAWVDAMVSVQLCALKNQYGNELGSSVLIDVGSRSVSLIVSASDELPFIRTFNFGGSSVTQSLAKHLGKSFKESERVKLEWIHNQSDPANLEILNQVSEGFVTRLVKEVQRSLALYRRQGQLRDPARILLSGGASQLHGLADFVERKTSIPCSFYDPFRGISSGPGLATSQTTRLSYSLSAPLGMAFSGMDSPASGANLLPQHASSRLELFQKKPWLIAVAALVLLSGLLFGLKFHMQARHLEHQVALLETELAPIESLSQSVNVAHESYTRLSAAASAKTEIIEQRQYWVAFLADLQQRLNQVQDVWLESIASDETTSLEMSDRLRVTGSLLDRENPLSLVSSNSRGRVEVLLGLFENSPFIQSIEDRRFDTSQPGILQFDVSLIVNPEAAF